MTTVSTELVTGAPVGGDAELPIGTMVGEYTIDAVLGRGGFGTVYRGVHPVIGKQVAIKVLARKFAADEMVISRFAAEARAVNQINHHNIIDIFQFSQLADGRHYYIMECLEGETLDAYLKEHGPLALADAVPILRAIGRALDAAHAKGIAHRDLKPENIFLARDADGALFPKLLDFGIAKLLGDDSGDIRHRTATGVPIGTPYYMSPEQCRGKDVDQRTDVYSFGILAYRLLTGAYPFDGDDYVELLFKQVNEEAPPPSSKNPALPATVDAAIAWMMRKDPAARPKTLAEALAAFADASASPSVAPIASGKLGIKSSPDAFAQTMPPKPVAVKPPRRAAVWIGSGLVLVAGVMMYVKTQAKSGDAAMPSETQKTGEALGGKGEPPPPPLEPATPQSDPNTASVQHAVTTPKPLAQERTTFAVTFEHLATNAQIFVDGEQVTPPIEVEPGPHTILIKAPGMLSLSKRIDGKAPVTIDAKQSPAPREHKPEAAKPPPKPHDSNDIEAPFGFDNPK
ncbi:MAG: serine/threonine-protein kinase [Kofleriaceae bacterium]